MSELISKLMGKIIVLKQDLRKCGLDTYIPYISINLCDNCWIELKNDQLLVDPLALFTPENSNDASLMGFGIHITPKIKCIVCTER